MAACCPVVRDSPPHCVACWCWYGQASALRSSWLRAQESWPTRRLAGSGSYCGPAATPHCTKNLHSQIQEPARLIRWPRRCREKRAKGSVHAGSLDPPGSRTRTSRTREGKGPLLYSGHKVNVTGDPSIAIHTLSIHRSRHLVCWLACPAARS